MLQSILCMLLLPVMVFSLGPQATIRNVLSVRSVLNRGLITCDNCPVISFNTTDTTVTTLSLKAGTAANTYAVSDTTGKYYMAPGKNDQYILEWSPSPFYWLFTIVNGNIYTISDVATTANTSRCWITSSGNAQEYGLVNFDTCPGTIPSAWSVQ